MNTPKTPKLFVIVSLLVVASMALAACGNAASPAEAAQACGELGVKSFDSKGFECNEAPAAATSESAPTQETVPTAAPTTAPTQGAPAQPEPADHVARLIELDKVYRAKGWMAWLKAAGVTCDAAVEARQPEEETVTDAAGVAHVVVSGLQVKGNCQVPYPAVVTTDRPGDVTTTAQSRTYQPDLKNPSVMYTDVDLHGQGTIWVDASNWSQMDPTK